MKVAVIGCGLIGHKRASVLDGDELVGCFDIDSSRAQDLASKYNATVCSDAEQLFNLGADVIVVATTHDNLADLSIGSLKSGSHVLVEKPAGISSDQISEIKDVSKECGKKVKVGFNHRFYPGIEKAITEAKSGTYGKVMFMRSMYGHGARLGYEKEWRARRSVSGGGELIDQGMHLLDISYWLLGPLALHSSLLKTNYWDMEVEDNAVLTLSDGDSKDSPWSLLHVSWSEWKNMFSMEIYCETAKFLITGLSGSYGNQSLRIYKMRPEMGPPDIEEESYDITDSSWENEWISYKSSIESDGLVFGDLDSAHYAFQCCENAYASSKYYIKA